MHLQLSGPATTAAAGDAAAAAQPIISPLHYAINDPSSLVLIGDYILYASAWKPSCTALEAEFDIHIISAHLDYAGPGSCGLPETGRACVQPYEKNTFRLDWRNCPGPKASIQLALHHLSTDIERSGT